MDGKNCRQEVALGTPATPCKIGRDPSTPGRRHIRYLASVRLRSTDAAQINTARSKVKQAGVWLPGKLAPKLPNMSHCGDTLIPARELL